MSVSEASSIPSIWSRAFSNCSKLLGVEPGLHGGELLELLGEPGIEQRADLPAQVLDAQNHTDVGGQELEQVAGGPGGLDGPRLR